MFARLTAAILRHRWVALVVLTTLVVGVSAGAVRLGVDFSVREFFPQGNPETTFLEEYRDRWHEDDMLVIVLDGGETGLLDRDVLKAIDALVTKLESTDGVAAVRALPQLPRMSSGGFGIFIPKPLVGTAPPADAPPERVTEWRAKILADEQVVPMFLSKDGQYGNMLVRLSVDNDDVTAVRSAVAHIEEVIAAEDLHGVKWLLGGVPAIRADIIDVVVGDQMKLVPISGALMALMLWLVFRSRHGVLIPAVAAGVPTVMLLGHMGWVGEPINALSQVLLVLVPAMCVAEAVHFVTRYHEELKDMVRENGGVVDNALRDKAIIRTMSLMGVATFLTSFTNTIGFASITITDLPVLYKFGLYAAIGVTYAYMTVLLVVPLALLAARRIVFDTQDDSHGLLGSIMQGCWYITTKHPVACLLVMGSFTGVMAYTGTWVQSDWRVSKTFDDHHPTTIANHILDEELGGLLALEFDLQGEPGVFDKPEVLAAIDRLEAEARKAPEVRATVSVAALLRNASVLVGGPNEMPTKPNVLRMLYKPLEDTKVLSAFVTPERDHARVLVRTSDPGSIRFVELGHELSEDFATALKPFGVTAHLTGSSYVAALGMSDVTESLTGSLAAAFLGIGAIVALLFRSLRFGLLTLAPNALPMIIGFGAMGVFGWPLEPAPAVVYAVAAGLAVDSAIHILARFGEERAKGLDVDQAIHGAIFHTGRAIAITSIILLVGFGVNMFSSSPANAAFGKLGTLVIAVGLVSNIIVLPALLKLGFAGQKNPVAATEV